MSKTSREWFDGKLRPATIEECNRNNNALNIAIAYSQIDGTHHKAWCIDQMVRALTGDDYALFVKEYERSGEYTWDVGIAS